MYEEKWNALANYKVAKIGISARKKFAKAVLIGATEC